MAGWPYSKRRWRDRVITEYLRDTGKANFVAGEFIDWLRERPEHEVYSLVFGC
jgi:hypothetical protein